MKQTFNFQGFVAFVTEKALLLPGRSELLAKFGILSVDSTHVTGKFSRAFEQTDGTQVTLQSIGLFTGIDTAPVFARIPSGTAKNCKYFDIAAFATRSDYTVPSTGKVIPAGHVYFTATPVVDETEE